MNFNLREIGSKLSTRGWITVGGAALIGVVFIYLLLSLASTPSTSTLVAGQSPTQTGKITQALSTAGIPYTLSNNGTAVSVDTSKEAQARVVLGGQGLLLGTGGDESLENYLGKTSLGESNFQQEQDNTSALEQQLDQSLESVNGINQAEVTLAIPDQTDDLFSGTTTQASAAVLLNTNDTLTGSSVKAIAQQVANTVPGLSINKVSVTDQNGDLLWPNSANAGTGTGSAITAKQAAEQAYDTQEASIANAFLASTLGPNKAVVQVNADLNTDQQTISAVNYGSPKKGVPLQQTSGNEKLKGTGTPTGGTAGNTPTQIASYAGTAGSGNSNYSNQTRTTTYGQDKAVSQTVKAPGTVQRQTIAVLVNSTVPATQIPTIQSAVQNVVGFRAGRDTISVGAAPFQKVTAATAGSSSSKLGDIKYVLVGVGALAFLFFMSRLLRKRETDDFAGRPTWLRELETPRPLSELEAQTQMVDLDGPTVVARLRAPVNVARQQVEELVDRDPERVASQLRQWMTED
jgi:flagellar M-ring protein FliF